VSLDAYERLSAKIVRANLHIRDLQTASDAFLGPNPYGVLEEHDTQTREFIYRVTRMPDVPDPIRAILGDAVNNLRSALDHTAWAFGERCVPPIKDERDIYFPIHDSATKYEAFKTRRIVQDLWRGAIDVLDQIKPYKGGSDLLWKLGELNNRDKHRLLIAVASVNNARTMTMTELEKARESWTGERPKEVFIPADLAHIVPSDMPTRILKTGDVLLRFPDSEAEHKPKVMIQIALAEIGVSYGEPLIPLIYGIQSVVSYAVSRLSDLL
jgi:hypothetical protein